MAAKTVAANKAALARAREARERLDVERRAQEQRQDEATATALMGLAALAEIDAQREAQTALAGAAVRALMEQDVSAERAAGLLGIDAGEVRRLAKVAAAEVQPGGRDAQPGKTPAKRPAAGEKATVSTLPSGDGQGSEDAERRAG